MHPSQERSSSRPCSTRRCMSNSPLHTPSLPRHTQSACCGVRAATGDIHLHVTSIVYPSQTSYVIHPVRTTSPHVFALPRATPHTALEPWLSSCRAVEAPSRRCRGAVEVLSRCCRGLACRACRVPVESLSSLSSLTPCAWASRSVEVCRGLSRSVEVCRGLSSSCRVAVELSSCRAVSRAVELCKQYIN